MSEGTPEPLTLRSPLHERERAIDAWSPAAVNFFLRRLGHYPKVKPECDGSKMLSVLKKMSQRPALTDEERALGQSSKQAHQEAKLLTQHSIPGDHLYTDLDRRVELAMQKTEDFVAKERGAGASSAAGAAAASTASSAIPPLEASFSPLDDIEEEMTYPVELFVDPASVQDFICDMPQCGHVVSQPPAMNCQHKYCGSCLAGCTNKICPACRESYTDQKGKLCRQLIGFIQKKRVRCAYHALGCAAEYEIGHENRNILEHRRDCQFAPLICNACGEKVPKVSQAIHIASECPERTATCGHCDEQMPASELKVHQTPVLDRVSDLWMPCCAVRPCTTRCRDENGAVRFFKPFALTAHEIDCTRARLYYAHPLHSEPYPEAMTFDEAEEVYTSHFPITAHREAIQALIIARNLLAEQLSKTGASPAPAIACPSNLPTAQKDAASKQPPILKPLLSFPIPAAAGASPSKGAPAALSSSPKSAPFSRLDQRTKRKADGAAAASAVVLPTPKRPAIKREPGAEASTPTFIDLIDDEEQEEHKEALNDAPQRHGEHPPSLSRS